jgi:putative ABC transport system permease protein
MVRPTGIREFYQLNQEFNEDDQTQAVLTGQGMARLFDLLDQGKNILGMVSYLALAMGAATVFLDIYAVGTQRRRETAILRSLGAGRWSVFGVAFIEALLTSALGILFGLTVGHLTAWVIAERIQDASAIYVNTTFVTSELAVAVAVLMLASAAGLIPAAQSYQQDVAANLT